MSGAQQLLGELPALLLDTRKKEEIDPFFPLSEEQTHNLYKSAQAMRNRLSSPTKASKISNMALLKLSRRNVNVSAEQTDHALSPTLSVCASEERRIESPTIRSRDAAEGDFTTNSTRPAVAAVGRPQALSKRPLPLPTGGPTQLKRARVQQIHPPDEPASGDTLQRETEKIHTDRYQLIAIRDTPSRDSSCIGLQDFAKVCSSVSMFAFALEYQVVHICAQIFFWTRKCSSYSKGGEGELGGNLLGVSFCWNKVGASWFLFVATSSYINIIDDHLAASLLFAVASGGRRSSKPIRCVGQLRQRDVGVFLYEDMP